MSVEIPSEGGWPGGWLIAAVAGVVGAVLAIWIGDVGVTTALLDGIFVFLVFGVVMGMFWGVPAGFGHEADHGHDHSQDHDHGRGNLHDHGHDPASVHVPGLVAAAGPILVMPQTNYSAPVPEPVPEPLRAPVAEPVAVPASVAVAAPEAATGEVVRPLALAAPRDGKGDDLQMLEGIGPGLEKQCHELGIWHFDQIAGWGPAEVAWMDGNLKGFRGRVTRDRWVAQAKLIGAVGTVEFLRRAKTNDY